MNILVSFPNGHDFWEEKPVETVPLLMLYPDLANYLKIHFIP